MGERRPLAVGQRVVPLAFSHARLLAPASLNGIGSFATLINDAHRSK
jgi:hypothetical protein